MKRKAIRMGRQPERKLGKTLIILVFLAVIGIGFVLINVVNRDDDEEETFGCEGDEQCPEGSICALGGCLILLSSEHKGVWKDEIAEQLDMARPWKPAGDVGEPMIPTSECPTNLQKEDKPIEKNMIPLSEVSVYALSSDQVLLHMQKRVKGVMWLNGVRFWLPGVLKVDTGNTCLSKSADNYRVGTGRHMGNKTTYLDAYLRQASPAGSMVSLSMSTKYTPPKPDESGYLNFKVDLKPIPHPDTKTVTIMLLPLGTDTKKMI